MAESKCFGMRSRRSNCCVASTQISGALSRTCVVAAMLVSSHDKVPNSAAIVQIGVFCIVHSLRTQLEPRKRHARFCRLAAVSAGPGASFAAWDQSLGEVSSPSPSGNCMITELTQRPNLKPTERISPARSKPCFSCRLIEAWFSVSPMTATIWRKPSAVQLLIKSSSSRSPMPSPVASLAT